MIKDAKDKINTPEEAATSKRKLIGKVLCVLLAVILWFYVSYDKNPETTKGFANIPVSLAGIEVLEGRNLTVLSNDMYVSVKLSGTRNILAKVNKKDIKAIVNLSDITTVGEQNPILTITGIPDALNVDEKKIASGKLVIDNLVKKNLDLNIEFKGKMGDSVIEGEKTVSPTQITVKGPGSILGDVTAWTTEVDISNIKQSVNMFTAGVLLKDKSGNPIEEDVFTLSDTSATVMLKCMGKKELPIAMPEIVGSRAGYEVKVEKIEPETVIVTGTIEDVNLIDQIELEDIDAYTAKENERVKLILPEYISCETTRANVKLKIEKIETN